MTQSDQLSSSQSPADTQEHLGLFDHLRELRKRLLYAGIAIGICAAFAFIAASELFAILTAPFYASFGDFSLIGTGPAEAFVLKLKAAFFAGMLLSTPVLFTQIWLFIAPGLYEHERKMAIPFVLTTSVLFLIGVAFAYTIVVPFAFAFFRDEYLSIGVTPTIRISEFLSITLKILIGFGLIFEVPIIAYFLGRLGVITDTFLIQYFRHALVLMFVVAALLTPPDIITQFLMAGPLVLLYILSIVIVRYTGKSNSED